MPYTTFGFNKGHKHKAPDHNQEPTQPMVGLTTHKLRLDATACTLYRGNFWSEGGYLLLCLQVPIAVLDPSTEEWRIVHWIDSKACFGDERTHKQHLDGQYSTYWNRYGTGMVIYWFGYLEGLEGSDEVVLMDHFPQGKELRVMRGFCVDEAEEE